jgi:hypothetical protein
MAPGCLQFQLPVQPVGLAQPVTLKEQLLWLSQSRSNEMIKKIKMSELSEFDPSKYLDDDEALRFSSSGMKDCQYSHRERHWIPAFAGSEWGIRIVCDPPTQQSSHAGDDDF